MEWISPEVIRPGGDQTRASVLARKSRPIAGTIPACLRSGEGTRRTRMADCLLGHTDDGSWRSGIASATWRSARLQGLASESCPKTTAPALAVLDAVPFCLAFCSALSALSVASIHVRDHYYHHHYHRHDYHHRFYRHHYYYR